MNLNKKSNAVKYLFGKMGRDLGFKYQKDLAVFFQVSQPTISQMVKEGIIYTSIIERVLKNNARFDIGTIALLDYIIGGKIAFNFVNEFDHERLLSFNFGNYGYKFEKAGITPNTFHNIRHSEITYLLKFLGEEAEIERKRIEIAKDDKNDEEIEVRLIPVKVNAGSGYTINSMRLGKISISKFLIGKNGVEDIFAIYAHGESMIKEGIVDDTLLICKDWKSDSNIDTLIGNVVIAIVDGVLVVKKFHRDEEGKLHLLSNTFGKKEDYDLSVSEFRIIGTVINSVRWF